MPRREENWTNIEVRYVDADAGKENELGHRLPQARRRRLHHAEQSGQGQHLRQADLGRDLSGLDRLWEDRAIRGAILTGARDRHFCGGHNLAPRKNITEEEREYLRTQRVFWPLAGTANGQKTGLDGRMGDHYLRVWKPVIAAVNSWAAGAGLYILLSSTDISIASAERGQAQQEVEPRTE